MSNVLAVFDVSGAGIRFGATEDGTPYAVASDFAKAMGYSQASDATRLLDPEEKGQQIVLTPGGEQRLNVVYEDGMWELIFRSSLPGAKAIKARVKAILRQIRETGRYEAAPREMTKLEALQAALESEQARIKAEQRVAELEPAAHSWTHLAAARGDFTVTDAAKILSRDPSIEVGSKRLFDYLADAGWIYRDRATGQWAAYQSAVTIGRLTEKATSYRHPKSGQDVLGVQVRVTVKGLADLHRRLGGSTQLDIPFNPAA